MGMVTARSLAIPFLLLLFSMEVPQAQILGELETGHSCDFHGGLMPKKVTTFASDAEAEDVITRIVEQSGIPQNFEIRAGGVPNAAAVVQGTDRFIVYNQYFMTETRNKTQSRWGPISIMAHEVGHHLSGHTLQRGGSRPEIELEADYFSGFILQKMGASLSEARIAMEVLGSPSGSATHPAQRDRLAAITNGWRKSCGSADRCSRGEALDPDPQQRTNDIPNPDREPPPQRGANSCKYAFDGDCDEPDICDRGTDTADCRRADRVTNPPPSRPLYCCDVFGQRRCLINVNPGPPGSPCQCYGIYGVGRMCQ